MTRRAATIVMVLLGTVMLLVIAGVALTAWMFVSVIDTSRTDATTASRTFDDALERFAGTSPVILLERGSPHLTRRPAAGDPPTRLNRLQVLAWDDGTGRLIRATLPFWVLRLHDGPINLSGDSIEGIPVNESLPLSVQEIERFGPALLLDERHGGDRVVVWTE